jgi:hypothetical protein
MALPRRSEEGEERQKTKDPLAAEKEKTIPAPVELIGF